MEDLTEHSIQLDVTSLATLKESLPSLLRDLADAGLLRDAQVELLHAVIRQMGGSEEMHAHVDAVFRVEPGSAVEPAAADPAAVEPAPAVDPAAVEPAAVDPAAVEPAAADPAAVEPAAVDPAAVEPAAVEPAPAVEPSPMPDIVAALTALVEPRETPRPTIVIPAHKQCGCCCQ